MAITVGQVALNWRDLTRAIEQKQQNPQLFQRVYIGRIEPPAHKPVHGRRAAEREEPSQRAESFLLGEPLEGIALTRREIQVLYLICQGYTNQGASDLMQLSVRTTEYYIKNLRRKILAKSKVHLVKQILSTDFMQRVSAKVLHEAEQDPVQDDSAVS